MFAVIFSQENTVIRSRTGSFSPGGGGGRPDETDGDARRKFWIWPLKETIWAWLKQILTP